MKLKTLVQDIYPKEIEEPFSDLDIHDISCDSRTVHETSLFVAIQGTLQHGNNFIPEVLRKGCRVVVTDRQPPYPLKNDVCLLLVEDARAALQKIANDFYHQPSSKLKIVGVTGTNGKTTITYLMESVLSCAGEKCGVIGTVNYRIGQKVYDSVNTTPGIIENQKLLATMVDAQVGYCVMEVSSHALDQGRVGGISFCAATFTNLTGDHLDYHKEMEHYFLSKANLFTKLSRGAAAIINTDDDYGRRLLALTKGKTMTYGINRPADVMAENIQLSLDGSRFVVKTPQGATPAASRLIGLHNIYNILATVALCEALGLSRENIISGIQNLASVPGRLEQVNCGQDFKIFVDYAHTDDALKNVLTNLKDVCANRIILVFGCGGNRDKTKRFRMGQVADSLADYIIVTNDNPRDEDPSAIVDQIKKGISTSECAVMLDRKEAIVTALKKAKTNDVVLIAGKGHETYQVFKDRTVHFDDREVVWKFFQCSL